MKHVVRTTSFEGQTSEGILYVDKTKYIHKLDKLDGVFYYLSRPSRFGLSQLLHSLKLFYSGRREVFKGLEIEKLEQEWGTYPIIHLNFALLFGENAEEIRETLVHRFSWIAKENSIKLNNGMDATNVYSTVIESLSKKGKVVVLIDEFTKPLRVRATSKGIYEIVEVYRELFGVLDSLKSSLKLCFVVGNTGLPRKRLSPFMDSFTDLTLSEEFSSILGYTQKELEDNFSEHIEKGRKILNMGRNEYLEKIMKWYGAYRFSIHGECLYNPHAVASFFMSSNDGRYFQDYWRCIGSIGYVIKGRAVSVGFDIRRDGEWQLPLERVKERDIIELANPSAGMEEYIILLYELGYFTIKETFSSPDGTFVKLGITDSEMYKGLESLLNYAELRKW